MQATCQLFRRLFMAIAKCCLEYGLIRQNSFVQPMHQFHYIAEKTPFAVYLGYQFGIAPFREKLFYSRDYHARANIVLGIAQIVLDNGSQVLSSLFDPFVVFNLIRCNISEDDTISSNCTDEIECQSLVQPICRPRLQATCGSKLRQQSGVKGL